jgi:hypothetical protein
MARTGFDWVEVFEGPAYMEMTEDGPQATWNVQVALGAGGKEYVLRDFSRRPARRIEADALAEKIKARGSVDLSLWVELEPRPSLEERFAMYAEREDEVRHGFRPEADMYHGL